MFFLKQSTAADIKLGPFVDASDGKTYEVGMAAAMDHATTGVRLSKNGAALADRNEATEPAYDAFGYYLVKLSTTDTDTVGTLKVIFGDSAVCLPCEANFQVLEAVVYDTLIADAAALKVDLVDAPNATAITAIQTSIKAITIADADSLGANTWLLWLRRLKWVLTGKLSVTDATGAFTLTKDDGVTAAGSGGITDDSTTTVRTVITWA